MSAKTERKRKAALAQKRHARKLEQEASRSKVYRGTGTGEWQQIDGITGWTMDVDHIDSMQRRKAELFARINEIQPPMYTMPDSPFDEGDWSRPWLRITNAAQEAWVAAGRQLAAERAIIAATVPAKNYVDRYHRRREWDAYRLTPEYQLRLAEMQEAIDARTAQLAQMLGIPDISLDVDEIIASFKPGEDVYANGQRIGTIEAA